TPCTVVAALAADTRPQPARQAVVLVARPERPVGVGLGEVPAVEGTGVLAQAVDVLQHVDLAVRGPRARPEHPERRPVTQAIFRVRLLDGGADLHLSPGCGAEVADGLDPARRPAGALIHRRDIKIAMPVEMDIADRIRHSLDFAIAEYALAGVVFPVEI